MEEPIQVHGMGRASLGVHGSREASRAGLVVKGCLLGSRPSFLGEGGDEGLWCHAHCRRLMALCGRVESAAQRTEVLQGFSRSSSSASSFTSVVEETEGVDGDDTGLVRYSSS